MLNIEPEISRCKPTTRRLPVALVLGATLLTAASVAPRALAKNETKKTKAAKTWKPSLRQKAPVIISAFRRTERARRSTITSRAAEPSYQWRAVAAPDAGKIKSDNPLAAMVEALGAGTTREEIEMTSQQWQGTTWTHRLTIFRPDKSDFADTAIIYVTFSDAIKPEEIAVGAAIAKQTGATFVNLSGIPKQPLWGFKEDGLISYTFEQYMKTGDATWPLLLPMTKSVVKAMTRSASTRASRDARRCAAS